MFVQKSLSAASRCKYEGITAIGCVRAVPQNLFLGLRFSMSKHSFWGVAQCWDFT